MPLPGAEVLAGLPCHHPAWPRYCPRCRELAGGTHATKIAGRVAVSRAVMACLRCKLVMIEAADSTHPLYPTLDECRAAVDLWVRGWEVVEADAADFAFCREGPG